MNPLLLTESFRPLPRSPRVRVATQLKQLVRLCDGDAPLDPFLQRALKICCRLFDASAGTFWLGGDTLGAAWVAAAREGLLGRGSAAPEFDLPGFDSRKFDLVEVGPLAPRDASDWVRFSHHTPSDSGDCVGGSTELVALMFSAETPVAAIELVLPYRGGVADPLLLENRYREALRGTMAIIQPALLRRLRVRQLSASAAEHRMNALTREVAGMQRSIRLAYERYLAELNGASFESFEENQALVRRLQGLLDAQGLRIRCPECGHPAILRCVRSAVSKQGVYVYDHYLPEGRTFHGGGRTFPLLRVISKPARRAIPARPSAPADDPAPPPAASENRD